MGSVRRCHQRIQSNQCFGDEAPLRRLLDLLDRGPVIDPATRALTRGGRPVTFSTSGHVRSNADQS